MSLPRLHLLLKKIYIFMGCDNEFRTILFDVRVADLSKV